MRRSLFLSAGLALLSVGLEAQTVLVDRGVRAGGLWCFPLASDERSYVYLPTDVRLAEDERGDPQFSFVRYVVNEIAESGDAGNAGDGITGSGGGGVLHFLVLYETASDRIEAARRELQTLTGDREVSLRGPIVFSEARFTLVSSILRTVEEREVLASGRAPVLEGNRLAFSFDLEPEKASLLLESFRMATPDVSLVFDLAFTGWSEAYDAELVIDWAEVRKSQAFEAGGSVYFVGADVQMAFDDLLRTHAIRLRSSGSDAAMEGLLSTVYAKLLDLLFAPVEAERVPAHQRGGLDQALSALLDPRSGPLSSRKTTGFGLTAGYQLKDLRSQGKSVLSFDHRTAVERHNFATFNIGDLYRRLGEDERFFRTVNLGDPAYLQREIHVAVDGALASEFHRYINHVTVTLRKKHQSGNETLRELVLDAKSLEAERRMVYGFDGDRDRLAWLEYEYRTSWSFRGGGTYRSDWISGASPAIDLFAPYERKTVELVASDDLLRERGIRAVVVELEYPFFGELRRERAVLRPGAPAGDPDDGRKLEITLPLGEPAYGYSITWMLEGGRRLLAEGTDGTGVLFLDEPPEPADEEIGR